MNPLSQDDKTVNFDLSSPAFPKQKSAKNPYKVVPRKEEPVPPQYTPLMRVGSKPVDVFRPAESKINKKILAAMADDPDPAASLAGIRKLLVGPTRNLHDAMFEEMITIIEESDRDVQYSLRALDNRLVNASVVSDNLIAESETIRDHTEKLSNYVRDEFERVEASSQAKISEMFLAIDSKIDKIAGQLTKQIEDLNAKHASDIKELTASFEQKMQAQAEKMEARFDGLQQSYSEPFAEVSEIPHVTLAERLRALREA